MREEARGSFRKSTSLAEALAEAFCFWTDHAEDLEIPSVEAPQKHLGRKTSAEEPFLICFKGTRLDNHSAAMGLFPQVSAGRLKAGNNVATCNVTRPQAFHALVLTTGFMGNSMLAVYLGHVRDGLGRG